MKLISIPSKAIQQLEDLRQVRFIVDDLSFYLYPGVRAEWNKLCANYEFRLLAVVTQQNGGCSRTLQTQHSFEIQSASQIDGTAKTLNAVIACRPRIHPSRSHNVVKVLELTEVHDAVEINEK